MKKLVFISIFISILFFFSACASKSKTATELVQYYNEEWIPILLMKKEKNG